MKDTFKEIQEYCLEKVKELIKEDTIPTEEAIDMAEKFLNMALEIEKVDLLRQHKAELYARGKSKIKEVSTHSEAAKEDVTLAKPLGPGGNSERSSKSESEYYVFRNCPKGPPGTPGYGYPAVPGLPRGPLQEDN